MQNVIVIGGGVAGLSAGIYARKHGLAATVLERHGLPGGNLTGWQRGGYHIDNCIHWLTGTNPATETYRLWQDLGALGGVPVRQGTSLYSCALGGRTLSLYRDLDRLRREMLALSPEDARPIRDLFRGVEAIQGICGIGGPGHDRTASPLRLARDLPLLIKYYRMTAGDLGAEFRHPLLRAFLSSFLTEDFGALGLLAVYANYGGDNGGIPQGGSLAMAERMARRLRALGGELRLNAEAVALEREGSRIRSVVLRDGTRLAGDGFILAGDPARAVPGLLGLPLPRGLERQYHDPRLHRFSSVQCAFACALDELPFEGDWICAGGRARLYLRSFGPEFAPPGRSLLQTMSFCDEAASRDWLALDPREYGARKQRIALEARQAVEAEFPALAGRLTLLDVWTPRTYRRYVDSEIGSWMSFAFGAGILPRQTDNRIKGVSNLALATQWLQPPGGLPIAAASGKRAAETLAGRGG